MQLEIIPEPLLMLYDWSLAGPSGASFILYPEKGTHTPEDVTKAKSWIRNNRDVVHMTIEWVDPKSQKSNDLYMRVQKAVIANENRGK